MLDVTGHPIPSNQPPTNTVLYEQTAQCVLSPQHTVPATRGPSLVHGALWVQFRGRRRLWCGWGGMGMGM